VPEGDTVWRAAADLHAALGGRVLDRSDFRVPRYATLDLSGRRVKEVAAYGKHLFVRLERECTLHTHFRMDGAWRLYRSGRAWAGPIYEVRVVLSAGPWDAVGYRLQVLDVFDSAQEQRITGRLGPDVLGDGWDADEAAARLGRDPSRPLGEALLDQRLVAGWGNVYRCEICFLSGLDPRTPVGRIDRLDKVAALGHRLMAANRTRHGHVTTGDPRPGRDHWVYGRAGRPCRRCGTLIQRERERAPGEGRVTYWCPTCQPLVRALVPNLPV
jgi:formamidopyrimidine-DNA glycosylase